MMRELVELREEVVKRSKKLMIKKESDRENVLVGIDIEVENIEEVIEIIRSEKEKEKESEKLMERRWKEVDVDKMISIIEDKRNKLKEENKYKI